MGNSTGNIRTRNILSVSAVVLQEELKDLQECLKRLPVEQQDAIKLHKLEGMSTSDIAVMSEVPEGTVLGRIRLGLKKLRNCMEAKR